MFERFAREPAPQPQASVMLLLGLEHLPLLLDRRVLSLKMVFNANGAIVFPVSRQHRDMKAEGISYEDDYKGTALAAMLAPGLIEARFHQAYSDADVARILRTLLAQSEFAGIAHWRATHQGRELSIALTS